MVTIEAGVLQVISVSARRGSWNLKHWASFGRCAWPRCFNSTVPALWAQAWSTQEGDKFSGLVPSPATVGWISGNGRFAECLSNTACPTDIRLISFRVWTETDELMGHFWKTIFVLYSCVLKMIVLWNKYLTFFRVAGLNLRGGGAWTSAASVLNAFLLGEDPESGPERLYLYLIWPERASGITRRN